MIEVSIREIIILVAALLAIIWQWWYYNKKEKDNLNVKMGQVIYALNQLLQRAGLTLLESTSPLNLTKEGERVVEESGITRHIAEHINEYSKELSPYEKEVEVFDKCKDIADRVLDKENKQSLPIREYAYDKGLYDGVIKEVFAVALREEYLNRNKKERSDK